MASYRRSWLNTTMFIHYYYMTSCTDTYNWAVSVSPSLLIPKAATTDWKVNRTLCQMNNGCYCSVIFPSPVWVVLSGQPQVGFLEKRVVYHPPKTTELTVSWTQVNDWRNDPMAFSDRPSQHSLLPMVRKNLPTRCGDSGEVLFKSTERGTFWENERADVRLWHLDCHVALFFYTRRYPSQIFYFMCVWGRW